MNIAIRIDLLVPGAEYFGSTTENTQTCFDALDWRDARPQPTWAEMEAAAAQELALIRARAGVDIDRAAEAQRARTITALPGKIGEYTLKKEVAARIVAADPPAQGDLDLLAREAAADGLTVAELAAAILQKSDEWTALALDIAGAAAEGKAAISTAIDAAAVAAVVDGVAWPEAVV